MLWRNSNFQYLHFILGACHTAIEAHRKCMEAIYDRELALDANTTMEVDTNASEFQLKSREIHLKQARDEVDFLHDCRERLEKHIGFAPTQEDYQKGQREEWKLELIHRAENLLITTGGIPTDDFRHMRLHPDRELILEKINSIKALMAEGKDIPLSIAPWKEQILLLESK